MTLTIPEEVRAKAEVYVGDAAGQEKTRLLLQETGLPSGLLPLRDIIECGYVEETGFVWLKQRRKVAHYFAGAGRHVTYGAEVSAVAEQGRLKKITGVKAKEMLIWVTLHEICLDDPPAGKLHCKAIGGLSRTFPVEAFEAQAAAGGGDGDVVPREVGAAADDDAATEDDDEEVEVKAAEAAAEVAVEKKDDTPAPADGDGVDKVEEKLKEMSTTADPAAAVAAKN